jgi:hypothetical protein
MITYYDTNAKDKYILITFNKLYKLIPHNAPLAAAVRALAGFIFEFRSHV